MLEQIRTYAEIAANLAVAVGVVVAVFHLRKAREANNLQRAVFVADHERRKKQSTIEFTHTVLEQRREVQILISQSFDQDHVNPTDPRYANNKELKAAVTRYLGLMERISVGINIGVYDLHTFSRITGRSTTRMFQRLWPVIESRRRELGYPPLFSDFERLVKDIERERESLSAPLAPEDLARIKHS